MRVMTKTRSQNPFKKLRRVDQHDGFIFHLVNEDVQRKYPILEEEESRASDCNFTAAAVVGVVGREHSGVGSQRARNGDGAGACGSGGVWRRSAGGRRRGRVYISRRREERETKNHHNTNIPKNLHLQPTHAACIAGPGHTRHWTMVYSGWPMYALYRKKGDEFRWDEDVLRWRRAAAQNADLDVRGTVLLDSLSKGWISEEPNLETERVRRDRAKDWTEGLASCDGGREEENARESGQGGSETQWKKDVQDRAIGGIVNALYEAHKTEGRVSNGFHTDWIEGRRRERKLRQVAMQPLAGANVRADLEASPPLERGPEAQKGDWCYVWVVFRCEAGSSSSGGRNEVLVLGRCPWWTLLRGAFLHASPILASTPWRRHLLLVSATPFLVLARLGLGRSPFVLDGSAITDRPSLLPSSSPVNARSCRRQKPAIAVCQWLSLTPTQVAGIRNRTRLAPCTYASAPDRSCALSVLNRHTHPARRPALPLAAPLPRSWPSIRVDPMQLAI
ncbi:hypothetical protein B0H13DRAFT_1897244 [Mycena leptocephala]|nr:hypothetical protein B0H13DRAFT_1897244 [Mycena leptocephala]